MLERLIRKIEASPVLFHLVNLLVASVWVSRAYTAVLDARMRQELHQLDWLAATTRVLLLLNLVLLVIFYVCRRRSTDTAAAVAPIVFAHLGSWVPLLFGVETSQPVAGDSVSELLSAATAVHKLLPDSVAYALLVVMAASAACLTVGFVSLGRSWGIIPANRGVRTGGLYRLVRHPIYSSYMFFYVAYVLVATSWLNVIVCVVAVISLYARTVFEEAVLTRDPEYAAYAQKTRYKLIPGIL